MRRVKTHLAYTTTPDDKLPYCTDDERWVRGNRWSVVPRKKDGEYWNKSAGSAESEELARALASVKGHIDYKVEFHAGEPMKCMHYCDARTVAPIHVINKRKLDNNEYNQMKAKEIKQLADDSWVDGFTGTVVGIYPAKKDRPGMLQNCIVKDDNGTHVCCLRW